MKSKMAEEFERHFGRPLRYRTDHPWYSLDLEGETLEAKIWVSKFEARIWANFKVSGV